MTAPENREGLQDLTMFRYELQLGMSMRRPQKRKHIVLAESSERLVRQLHTRPPGLPDTCLYPPNWIVCNPWPRWRTTCRPTTGNYLHSRTWWRDLRRAMRDAFLAAWYEQASPEKTVTVMGRDMAILTGLTS